MNRILCCLVFLIAVPSFAQVVDIESFQEGSFWTWSYSESTDGVYASPYLYETYEVTQVMGSFAKVEMSSGPSAGIRYEPHHFFIIDLLQCSDVKRGLGRLNGLRVHFYSKSFGDWELLSRKHDGLVFTEKFNCLENSIARKSKVFDLASYGSVELFQWQGLRIKSWYDQADGVAKVRFSRNYKMELVEQGRR